MSTQYADNLVLPWSNVEQESRRFRLILLLLFVIVLPLSIVIPEVTLPEKERSQLEALPPQLAKLIIEKKKVTQKPKEEPPKPEPEEKERKEEKKKEPEKKPPEPKREERPKIKPPPKQTVEQARQVAKSSGLLALQDDLADMRESLNTETLSVAQISVAKTIAAKASAVDGRRALAGSGGVDTAGMAAPAETVVLASRETTVLKQSEAEKLTEQAKKREKKKTRGSGNIRRVFDQNKSSLFTLYNRALRKNPSLQGKVVLRITIEPNGSVSACEIVSSDLEAPKLERKIISRVRLFNFGAMPVETKTVTYPIDFFQS